MNILTYISKSKGEFELIIKREVEVPLYLIFPCWKGELAFIITCTREAGVSMN
jgi:hypothetical protein